MRRRSPISRLSLVAALVLLSAAACSSAAPSDETGSAEQATKKKDAGAGSGSSGGTAGSSGVLPAIKTVFVIMLENHNWSQIAGNASAPYINGTLLANGAHAEQYFNPPGLHPSEPNYIWLEAGDALDIRDDDDPEWNTAPRRTT
jgi:hypothetical protein